MNAFQPATELDDPERFAGRGAQVRTLTDSLHQLGSVPLIYGDRGLGKSSLALQLRLIAMGSVELLDHLGATRLALSPEQHYLVFYVTCTSSTSMLSDLLQLMVNAAEGIEMDSPGAGATQLVDRSTRKKLTLKVVEIESTRNYQVETQRLSYQELNLEEKVVKLADLLTVAYGQPVLFVIDELDRMGDTAGLASFLKAASSENLKFLLVGIAGSVSDLLTDHQSLERRLNAVRVPIMPPGELAQVALKAQAYLSENGIRISFDQSAIAALVRVSGGFPWFVHVLGQAALVAADSREADVVTEADIRAEIDAIVRNRFAQQFADTYQMAVRDSMNRESTLRAFAQWTDSDIPTSEIYRLLSMLNINGPSTYRGHLCRDEYGAVLFTPAFQKRGLVRFRNEMFKAYVRMRPSIYAGVDHAVREAYQRLYT